MSFEIALPEDDSRTFGDYIDALKRRGKPALIMAASLFLAGIVGIVVWPNAYTSTAVILIEDPDIPRVWCRPPLRRSPPGRSSTSISG